MSNETQTFDHATCLRIAEALIFAAEQPVTLAKLEEKLGKDVDLPMLIAELQQSYEGKGLQLVSVAGGYAFRTSTDVAALLKGEAPPENKKPPRAATETLAIIAYHQPVTRAEIEAIRGVQVSRGTLDILMEAGWVRPGKRRETPGRPVTWLTTPEFLEHFGLSSLRDLPGIEELKAAGLLDAKPVLATVPAEGEFEALEDAEYGEEGNDFLPAGDEQDDTIEDREFDDEDADETEASDEDDSDDDSDDDIVDEDDDDFDDEDEDDDATDEDDGDETTGRYAAE
ncbi:MAG: SMC-Scp complex subunit ScpB [Bdellovibrionales bacterium]